MKTTWMKACLLAALLANRPAAGQTTEAKQQKDDRVASLAAADVAYEQKDYAKALALYAAEAGYPDGTGHAEGRLGMMYHGGLGVPKDREASFGWWLKAAKRGDGWFRRQVALAYLDGDGVAQNYEEAFAWTNDDLAERRRRGSIFPPEEEKIEFLAHALEVLEPAAENGDAKAQYFLGEVWIDADVRSYRGDGPVQRLESAAAADESMAGMLKEHRERMLKIAPKYDYQTAFKWFAKSAAGQYPPAMIRFAKHHAARDEHGDALRWYLKAANLGSTRAQDEVARCYYEGRGVTQDFTEGDKWWLKSVRNDGERLFDFAKQYLAGESHWTGKKIIPRDSKRAFELFMMSATLKHARAQRAVSAAYYNGDGVAKDLNQAKQWSWQAANCGDSYSQFVVGSIFDSGQDMFTGRTGQRNAAAGFKWFLRAATAEKGPDGCWNLPDQRAMFAVGWAYFHANGVAKDNEKSQHWMKEAVRYHAANYFEYAKDIPALAQKFLDENFK